MGYSSTQILSYPFMERQDLTQGQLGSFKFTPVDRIGETHSENFTLLGPRLAHELEQNAVREVAARMSQHQTALYRRESYREPHPTSASIIQTPNPAANPAFFNTHIKKDLTESRLKLGPAILRSAVQSASGSPTKLPRPDPSFIMDNTFTAPSSHHKHGPSDMNPGASPFTPAPPSLDHGFGDPAIVAQSLFRALTLEQQAHHETQLSLQDTSSRLTEAEAKVNKIAEENKSLISTIHMLGSIIKHNAEQDKHCVQPPIKHNEFMSKDIMNQSPRDTGTILYDVLALQKATYQMGKEDQSTNDQSTDLATQDNQATKHTNDHVFDLASLESSDKQDQRSIELSHTIRRHFIIDSNDAEQEKTSKFFSKEEDSKAINDAVDQTDQDVVRSNEAVSDPGAVERIDVAMRLITLDDLPNDKDDLQASDKSTLKLPDSFLTKYKKQTVNEGNAQENVTSNAKEIPSANDELEIVERPIADVVPPRPPLRSIQLVNPSEINPQWHITLENPVYTSDTAILSARQWQSQTHKTSVFWKYPVRYLDYSGKNIFRTIMIDYIPLGSTYKDVLGRICGGSLESIQLLGPINEATGFMTARVVFNYELGAATTANYARNQGMKINGTSVRVWRVKTQTYPKNEQLDEDVFTNGYTRLLLIDNVSEKVLSTIGVKLARLKHQIVEVGRAHDGVPMVEFTSVAAAARALRQLVMDPDFGGGVFDFEEDPCAEPY